MWEARNLICEGDAAKVYINPTTILISSWKENSIVHISEEQSLESTNVQNGLVSREH